MSEKYPYKSKGTVTWPKLFAPWLTLFCTTSIVVTFERSLVFRFHAFGLTIKVLIKIRTLNLKIFFVFFGFAAFLADTRTFYFGCFCFGKENYLHYHQIYILLFYLNIEMKMTAKQYTNHLHCYISFLYSHELCIEYH